MDEDDAFIEYIDFNKHQLVFLPEETKIIHDNNGKNLFDYTNVRLQYEYTDEICTDLFMHLPVCKSTGILTNANTSKSSIIITFNQTNNSKICIKKINDLYDLCYDKFSDHEDISRTFKSPLQRKRQNVTMRLKVDKFSKFLYPDMTDIDPSTSCPILKLLSWDQLKPNDKLKIIPLVKFECINIDSKVHLQCILESAIIIDNKKDEYRQTVAFNHFYKNNKDFINKEKPKLEDYIGCQLVYNFKNDKFI